MAKLSLSIFGVAVAIAIHMPMPAMAQGGSQETLALDAQVAQLYGAGKYMEALPIAQRELALVEKALGPNHPNVAAAVDNVANIYNALGRYADAEPLFKRALAIREKALGPNHPEVGHELTNLATLYKNQTRYAEAEPLFKRALAIREKALGPNNPEVAWTLIGLAEIYEIQGRYGDAEPLFKRALEIREIALGPDSPEVSVVLTNLAILYAAQARYSEAESAYKRSIAIREKKFGPDHPAVALSLNGLAVLYRDQARYDDAEPLLKRALAIRETSFGPNHPDVADSLNNLAALYQEESRYADAEPLYQRSLAIREKAFGSDSPNIGQSLINLANLYRSEGHIEQAGPLYERALAIREKTLGPDHPATATALNNLATLYASVGRFASAEPLYQKALAIREKTLGPDHPDTAASLANLARVYERERRYADAEPLLKRSLTIGEKTFGPNHPNVAGVLNSLAFLYQDEARYADAEPLYRRALTIAENALGPEHPDAIRPLGNLATLYGVQGRYADALPLTQRLMLSPFSTSSAVLQLLFGAQRNKLISAEEALNDALYVVERQAQTSASAAINKLAIRLASGSDRLAQLVRQDQDLAAETESLNKDLVAAVSQEQAKRDAAAEQRVRERLVAIAKQREGLQKTFMSEFPDYATLTDPLPMKAKDIQALLSDDEVLVLFADGGDKETYIFAFTRTGFDWNVIPLGGDTLAQKVAIFRHGLDVDMMADDDALDAIKLKRELFDLGFANELYTSLLGPVEPALKNKSHLLVAPFGPLTALPFHLLVTEKPRLAKPSIKGRVTVENMAPYREAAWLNNRQAVSVMPSITSLKALRQFGRKDRGSKPLIGFGDPIFNPAAAASDQRRLNKTAARSLATRSFTDFWQGAGVDKNLLGQALPQLPDTADELKAVALKVGAPAADIHLGRDASETVVKRTVLSDYRIVYFATHGLVAGDIKGIAEPSLALTIPPQPSEFDDGLLTASEVALLKLNADWVVLSACNTIAGDKPGAEALSGLARAFFYAGARALLVSHWSVASDAATRLTTATFDVLNADPKLGRAEAMRRAMLAYLADPSQPRNAYPAIWGPFSIIGEGAAAR